MRLSFLVGLFLLFTNSSLSFANDSEILADRLQVDADIVCQYYPEFKKLNKVLCAYASQFRESDNKIMVSKRLACLYPTVRSDARICPKNEVESLDLPKLPYLLDAPVWPANMKPILNVVNGKALNVVLEMHSAFYNNEYSLDKYCISKDGLLKYSDRLLCGPYVQGLYLVEPMTLPTKIVNALVPFDYASTTPTYNNMYNFQASLSAALYSYKQELKNLGISFSAEKLKAGSIRIVGHADKTGSSTVNWELSRQRAQSTYYQVINYLSSAGIKIDPAKVYVDWVGDSESSCYQEYSGQAVCVTEDAYGRFVSGRRGWRAASGSDDRCYNDENGRNGWIYPKKTSCGSNDRSSTVSVTLEFELFDKKDLEIRELKERLKNLERN